MAGRILCRMGTKSRETIYGASVRAAAERATEALEQAHARLSGSGARPAGHQGRDLTQALYDEAKKKNWTAIGMKNDWKKIFSFE